MSQLRWSERVVGVWYRRMFSPMYAALLRLRGIEVGERVTFYGLPVIQRASGSRIVIGDGCTVCSHATYTAMGVQQPVTIKTLQPQAIIRIGRNVGASGCTVCATVSVDIGDDCLLGSGCCVVDTDFHPVAAAGRRRASITDAPRAAVRLGSNVFVGARALVGKGVTIGDNAVVGAMSVVTSPVPADVVVAGVPARVVRHLGCDVD